MLAADDTKPAAPADKGGSSLEAAPGEYSNSVTIGGGTSFVGGDRAQFQRQLRRPAQIYGGIEELHFEQAVGKKGLLSIDGRGIYDNHDYDIQIDLRNPEIGYVTAGYSEFRTWYDGSGGYAPASNTWVSLYDEGFYIDRKHAFIAAGLTRPGIPEVSVRYDYDQRVGMKDSTSWGDYLVKAPSSTRGLTPTFLGIDETRHTFQADVKHTLGNTTAGVGLRYETDQLGNSRNIARRVGEPTLKRYVTSKDDSSIDYWNAHAFTETQLHPKVQLTTGYSFTRSDTDLAGSRIYGVGYGSQFSTSYLNKQERDEGYYDLGGGSKTDQFVANVNLLLTPSKNWTIVPSVKIEHQNQEGDAVFTETNIVKDSKTSLLSMVQEHAINSRVRRFTDISEGLAARYTGMTNWSFYARGDWIQGEGTLRERQNDIDEGTLGPVVIQRDTESTRRVQKYTTGANWYPHRKVNAAIQYYYRVRENDYDHGLDTASVVVPGSSGNLYPAFIEHQEFDTHDVNFRVTFRPLANVTLVSRYDYQMTSYNLRGGTILLGGVKTALNQIESARMNNHILSQSIGWTPMQQLYFQGSISYAMQNTDSPVSATTGAGANLVQNAKNDYWNASLTTGVVLTERCDLQGSYVYYRANNYQDNSAFSLPYGAGAESHGATATLITRLRKDLIWKLQYGYFTGHDQLAGGHNDYSAHLVYSSVQYLF